MDENQIEKIILRIINGDLTAYKTIVKSYDVMVFNMVKNILKDEDDIKDVCQEVFIKVYKNLKNFKYKSKFSTWVIRIAYTTAINHLKKYTDNKNIKIDLEFLEQNHFTDMNPEKILEKKTISELIHHEISILPLPYRTVLTLFHLQEFKYEEIIEITGLSEGTVKSHLFRARKILKENLKKHLTDLS